MPGARTSSDDIAIPNCSKRSSSTASENNLPSKQFRIGEWLQLILSSGSCFLAPSPQSRTYLRRLTLWVNDHGGRRWRRDTWCDFLQVCFCWSVVLSPRIRKSPWSNGHRSNPEVPRVHRGYRTVSKRQMKHFVNSPVLRKAILQFSSSQRVTAVIYFTWKSLSGRREKTISFVMSMPQIWFWTRSVVDK